MRYLALIAGSFLLAAVVTAALTPLVAAFARWIGCVDRPGGRRVHQGEVPRLGGVAVMLGLLAGALLYTAWHGWEPLLGLLENQRQLALLLPCGLVFLVGIVDDVRGLGPGPRIAIECVAAVMAIQGGYVIDQIALPNGGALDLGLLAFPVTLMWFVGVTNAFNLLDGLDGLLATVGALVLVGCAVVGLKAGMLGAPLLAVAFAGALVGFMAWNWHPASVFLGDSGSLLVGFAAAAISIDVARNANDAVSVHIPLALCALPIGETFLTLARRYVNGQAYFAGDRSHVHHVLLNKGLSVPRAVLALGVVTALFVVVAVLAREWQQTGALVTIAALLGAAVLGLRWLGYVEMRVFWHRLRQGLLRRRRASLRDAVAIARLGDAIEECASIDALHEQLAAAVREHGFTFLAVELAERALGEGFEPVVECANQPTASYLAGRKRERLWVFSADEPAGVGPCAAEASLAIPLPPGSGAVGRLVSHRYFDGQGAPPRGDDVRRYLAEPLARALPRLVGVAPEAGAPADGAPGARDAGARASETGSA